MNVDVALRQIQHEELEETPSNSEAALTTK